MSLFGRPVASCPVRRGRGFTIALLVHAAVLTSLMVSVTRYEEQPTPRLEPIGAFVMAPVRGLGSPAPNAARPPAREPSPTLPKPDVPQPSDDVPLFVVAPTIPLVAPPTLGVLQEPSASATGEAAQEVTAALEPAAVPGSEPSGSGDSQVPPAIGTPGGQSNWAGLVLGRLEQFRRYPSAARRERQQGISYVRFTIDRKGHVLDSSLDRSSGHTLLDREAVALVRRADPLPAPPEELQGDTVTLTAPVEFFLTR